MSRKSKGSVRKSRDTPKRNGMNRINITGILSRISASLAVARKKEPLLARRVVRKSGMLIESNNQPQIDRSQSDGETEPPTSEGTLKSAAPGMAGSSATAAGVITTIQDRGEKYSSD
jgi:hypothetical protein